MTLCWNADYIGGFRGSHNTQGTEEPEFSLVTVTLTGPYGRSTAPFSKNIPVAEPVAFTENLDTEERFWRDGSLT